MSTVSARQQSAAEALELAVEAAAKLDRTLPTVPQALSLAAAIRGGVLDAIAEGDSPVLNRAQEGLLTLAGEIHRIRRDLDALAHPERVPYSPPEPSQAELKSSTATPDDRFTV